MMNSKYARFILLLLCATLALSCSNNTPLSPYVSNVEQARSLLSEKRSKALAQLEQKITPDKVARLVELGLWTKAQNYLSRADTSQNEIKLIQARLAIKKHRYFKAEDKVSSVLKAEPNNKKAKLLRAKLYMQSWDLDQAEKTAKDILKNDDKNVGAGRIIGKAAMLQKDYDA